MDDCLFCRIIAGEIPSRQVYADEHAIAFLDIAPLQPGHALVVPRRHVSDALADADALAQIGPAVTATGRLLVETLDADGATIFSSIGEVAGQEIFHLHVHVVPRYADHPGLRGLFDRRDEADVEAVWRRLSR